MATIYRIKRFAKPDNREDVPDDIMAKVNSGDGVVQKDHNGEWRIVNAKKKKFWTAHYQSRESAEAGLRGYQASK